MGERSVQTQGATRPAPLSQNGAAPAGTSPCIQFPAPPLSARLSRREESEGNHAPSASEFATGNSGHKGSGGQCSEDARASLPHSSEYCDPQTAAGSSQSTERCLVHTAMSTSGRVTRGPVIHTEVFHKQRLTCVPADCCLRCPQEFSTYQQRILLLPGAPRSSTLPLPLRGRLGSTRGAGGMGEWRAGSPRGWRAQHRSYALRSVARVDPVAVRTEAAPPGGGAPTPAPTARRRVAHAWEASRAG